MTHRREAWHLERSIVALNAIRQQGVDYRAFEARAQEASGPLTRSRMKSLQRLWRHLRPIAFDPVRDEAPELLWMHDAYAEVGYCFFHPVWNLLRPPMHSSEKIRMRDLQVPEWYIEDARKATVEAATQGEREAAQGQLDALVRQQMRTAVTRRPLGRRRVVTAATLDVATVHCCMLQLRPPLRDVLMEPSRYDIRGLRPIDVPWVRRSESCAQALEATRQAGSLIDRLAATLALGMEAALVGRERDYRMASGELRLLRPALRRDPLFGGVERAVGMGVLGALDRVAVLETGLVAAQLAALPESWHPLLTHRMQELWLM